MKKVHNPTAAVKAVMCGETDGVGRALIYRQLMESNGEADGVGRALISRQLRVNGETDGVGRALKSSQLMESKRRERWRGQGTTVPPVDGELLQLPEDNLSCFSLCLVGHLFRCGWSGATKFCKSTQTGRSAYSSNPDSSTSIVFFYFIGAGRETTAV